MKAKLIKSFRYRDHAEPPFLHLEPESLEDEQTLSQLVDQYPRELAGFGRNARNCKVTHVEIGIQRTVMPETIEEIVAIVETQSLKRFCIGLFTAVAVTVMIISLWWI